MRPPLALPDPEVAVAVATDEAVAVAMPSSLPARRHALLNSDSSVSARKAVCCRGRDGWKED